MTGVLAAIRDAVATRLSRKLMLVLFAVLASISLLLLAATIGVYRNRLIAEHARASLEVNHLLQASLENAMLKRDIPGLREIVRQLGGQAGIAGVMIVNPAGEIRFSSDERLLGAAIDDERIAAALASRTPQTAFLAGSGGGELLRSVNPVLNKPQCRECHGDAAASPVNGLLVVDYAAAGIRDEAMRTAAFLGVSGLVVILAGGFGIWLAVNRLVLGRVDRLRSASMKLAGGDLAARVEIGGRDEIDGCAASFNRMAGQMQTMIEQIAAAEGSLQSIIDSIPDGVRVIDSDFVIVKANHAYCRQVGQEMRDVLGQKCHVSSHGRADPCAYTLTTCPVAELRGEGAGSLKFTDTHLAPGAGRVNVEVTAARVEVLTREDVANCVVESIRDLSQDVELSQKHRLSEIGLLATGVAHEIHNPLSSIELALTAIRDSMARSGRASEEQHYIDIARAEIEKCLSVTEGLLRLSEPPRDPELVDLANAIGDVLSLLSFQLDAGGIVAEIDMDRPLRVLASDSDVRMIAFNLAQNAIHAMPDKGRLRIVGRAEGDMVVLRFIDTGIGIAHEHLDRIFFPFWTRRADGSVGRGLGLSICKAIVERYGGRISVRSTLGQGTEFTVALPSADAARDGHAAGQGQPDPGHRG
ncbi:MAG: ATP-binding protein [Rhizobiaceae bacterium]